VEEELMMVCTFSTRRLTAWTLLAAGLPLGCATRRAEPVATPRVTERYEAPEYDRTTRYERTADHDKTLRGAGIGAAAGVAGAILLGKRAADDIIIGGAIGTAVGVGVGAYLDAQERKLIHIPGATVERQDRDTLLVRFDSDVLFEVDSARPTAQSLAALAEVGDLLVRYDRTAVVVQGHTDSTGPQEYNQELSEKRAIAVKTLLADRGVSPRRMAAIGHGELYPVASNGFEEGRRRNRRVTILLKARAA
jgi:outer membrane protein OmpA-like peptidoglycan-associated protein